MSYASIASQNAPPPSLQPKPDPNLLNTKTPSDPIGVADDASKLNVVGPKFKEHPTTVTSVSGPTTNGSVDKDHQSEPIREKLKRGVRNVKGRAHSALEEAEEDNVALWELTKEYLLRPGIAGGLMGIVNVGVFSWATYSLYNRPDLRTNPRLLTIGASASAALLAAEGSYASYVAKTPEGQREVERARREGSVVYYHVREAMFRPDVPGSLGAALGLINLAVVGGAGWLAYCYWDLPRWDKKAVSAITIGLVALWGGEGLLAEKYRKARGEYRRK